MNVCKETHNAFRCAQFWNIEFIVQLRDSFMFHRPHKTMLSVQMSCQKWNFLHHFLWVIVVSCSRTICPLKARWIKMAAPHVLLEQMNPRSLRDTKLAKAYVVVMAVYEFGSFFDRISWTNNTYISAVLCEFSTLTIETKLLQFLDRPLVKIG